MAAPNPAVPHLFLYPSDQTGAEMRMTWRATWITRNFVSLPVEDVGEGIAEVAREPALVPVLRSQRRVLVEHPQDLVAAQVGNHQQRALDAGFAIGRERGTVGRCAEHGDRQARRISASRFRHPTQ